MRQHGRPKATGPPAQLIQGALILKEVLGSLVGHHPQIVEVTGGSSDGVTIRVQPDTMTHPVVLHLKVEEMKILNKMPRPTRRRATLRSTTG